MTGSSCHGLPEPRGGGRVAARAAGLLATLAFAACGSSFSATTVEDFGTFRIDVINYRAPRAQIYLSAEGARTPVGAGEDASVGRGDRGGCCASDAAGEVRLGNAPVEGTTVFRLDLRDPSAEHRLRALLPRGVEVVSVPFVPGETVGVRWDLEGNLLTPQERSPVTVGDGGSGSAASPVGDRLRRPTGSRRFPPPR